MEQVTEKIAELLEKRERLLKERESNRLQIWICEQEIYTYTQLYETLSQLMAIKRDNIESYLHLIDYKRDNAPYGWPGLVSGYAHIVPMIDVLQEEYDEISDNQENAKGYIDMYRGKKELLEQKNETIDEKLADIEDELGIEHDTQKILIKGE